MQVRPCSGGFLVHADSKELAGARRERSVRRHRRGCRPAVLKFEEAIVQRVRPGPSRLVLNSRGEAHLLDCAALVSQTCPWAGMVKRKFGLLAA
jgi:hypothetical protein